jgi:O-antigen ligase
VPSFDGKEDVSVFDHQIEVIVLFSIFLWFLVWGGMFTGDYNIKSSLMFSNSFAFFQGFRALLPILAVYIVFVWAMTQRPGFPFKKNPVRFFFMFWLIGFTVSIFISPVAVKSLYWAMMYLSPFFVMWAALEADDPIVSLRWIMYINYGIFILLTLSLVPDVMKGGNISAAHDRMYTLPFNLGEIISNGVGRYALVSIIVAGTRFQFQQGKKKLLWLPLIVLSLYVLARTQSRTALLGFAVASILFFLMRKMDWRLIFAGPIASYVIWISGYKWRARGSLDRLVDLSGREDAWQRAIELIKQSPLLGWGFHADRILLQSEHMHNSFLHSMIQTGLIGMLFFVAAFLATWVLVFKTRIIGRIKDIQGEDKLLIMESVMILGFMTSRGFFESTAAYYGVDLLLLIPVMAFICLWTMNNPQSSHRS